MSAGRKLENTEKFREYLRLIRPYQWVKNIVVFLPVVFSGEFLDFSCWISAFIAFVTFCLASSSVYCFNDVLDCGSDRLDPEKRSRPVASGSVSSRKALLICVCLAITSVLTSMLLNPSCEIIVGVYLLINILYCLGLKQIMLLDVIILAIGFVLRVVMGGSAADIWISQWIIIMIFLLALFLALSKRRHEVVMVSRAEKLKGRKSVAGYTVAFLNSALSMLGAVIIIGYIMYTVQPKYGMGPEAEYLYVTALPVVFGILRYLQLSIVGNCSGDISKVVLKDTPLLMTGIIWILSFMILCFIKPI